SLRNEPSRTYPLASRSSIVRRPEPADDRDSVVRLRTDGVVGADVGGANPSVLVDDVAGRHRETKVRLVVKLVERVAKRRVQLLQIRWERERKPERLGHAEVEIRQ